MPPLPKTPPRWFPYASMSLSALPLLALAAGKLAGLASPEIASGIAAMVSSIAALAFYLLRWGPAPRGWLAICAVYILLGFLMLWPTP